MLVSSDAKYGRFYVSDKFFEKFSGSIVFTLSPDKKSLRFYSKKRWSNGVSHLQKRYTSECDIPPASQKMIASAHKLKIVSNFFDVPGPLLEKSGLLNTKLEIIYGDGVGLVFSHSNKKIKNELPAELTFSGIYFVKNEDAVLVVDFVGFEPELWQEGKNGFLSLMARDEKNDRQQWLLFGEGCSLWKYENYFYRTLRLIEKFTEDRDSLLRYFIKYGPSAVELAEDCPALAYIAATYGVDDLRSSVIQEIDLSPKIKRNEILSLAGYPEEQWIAKFFRKIPFSLCRKSFFNDLNVLLQAGDAKKYQILMHLRKVNLIAITTIFDDQFLSLFHRSFFDEVHMIDDGSDEADIYWQIYDLKIAIFKEISQGMRAPLVRRVDDLFEVHSLYVEEIVNKDQNYSDDMKEIKFPPPPFPEFQIELPHCSKRFGIFPITSGAELWEEGRRMHHCIAGQTNMIYISDGKYYAYHVELPEEEVATFTVEKKGEKWIIPEVKGIFNSHTSSYMSLFITQWLEQQVCQ